jgi:hypothetical protein
MTELISQTLADCLDEIQSGKITAVECLERSPELAEELAPLISLAGELIDEGKINPRPQFIETAHARLVNKLPVRRPGVNLSQRFPFSNQKVGSQAKFFYQAWFIAAIVLVMILTLGTGTVYASSQALPGDWLYPVKLNVEQVQLSLANPGQRVDLLVHFLGERRSEISALEKAGRYKDMTRAISKLEEQSTNLVDQFEGTSQDQEAIPPGKAENVDSSLSHNVEVLEQVIQKAPVQAQPALQHAIDKAKQKDLEFQDILTGKYKRNKNTFDETPGTSGTNAIPESSKTKPSPANTHKPDNPNKNGDNSNSPSPNTNDHPNSSNSTKN